MFNEYEVAVLQETRDILNEIGDSPKGIKWLTALAGKRSAQHNFHSDRMLAAGHPKEAAFHRNALNQIHAFKTMDRISKTAKRRGHSVLNTMKNSGSYRGTTDEYRDKERERLLGNEGMLKRYARNFGIHGTTLMNAKTGDSKMLKNNGAIMKK